MIDRTLFARALTNVIENALHAMPGGGRLSITTREEPAPVNEHRAVLVEIADTERRRIQRNLHDGAQQRLTAVLLTLGRVRESPEERAELIEVAIDELAAAGSLQAEVPGMQTRSRLYELVDYAAYSSFDEGVATFDLTNNRSA